MKKCLGLAISFLLTYTLPVFAQTRTISDLQGEWESTDKRKGGSVHFMDHDKILMIFPNGKILRGTYQVNFAHNPISIDIIRNADDTLQGLVEFIDDATIKWKIFPLHNRTDSLSKQKNTSIAVFKRKKSVA
jgi:hypothetical protein